MSESGASVQVKRETALALYQKATKLGTAVFKNKNSFLSEVELMWFGGSGDAFPFKLDKELNVCTRMPHQRVFDKFPTAIFPETPAKSKICSAKASNCRCGYVEIRGVNDAEYNVLKTAEYLFQREWVGVVHTSEGAKLYLLPTSQLTHHLGITSPSMVYHRILHGLFVRKEKSEPPSCTTSSSVITPPSAVEQHTSPSTATDINRDQSEQTSSSVALKATPVKRKTVSFADLPVKNDTQNSDNDVIEISPDVAPPPLALATATPEPKPEVKQKEAIIFLSPAIAQNIDITALRRTLQCVAVNDGLLAKSLTPARAADKSTVAEKETILPPQPTDSRDVLSDEESVASSVSSFASDTSSLSAERPTTRRRRGRGRRGRGRGKAVPNQDASFDAGKGLKTSVRGRNRRRGRGGKSVPELTRSASVETVEESIEAGASDKLFYEDLNKSSVAITRFEQSDVKSTIAHLLSGSSKLESTAPTKPDMTAPTMPIMSAPSELESTAPVSETLEGAVDKGSQKIKQDDFSTSQTPQETKRLDVKAQESASVLPTESPNDTVQPDVENVQETSTPKIDHESKTPELAPPSQATDSAEKSNVASTPEVVVSEQEVVKPDNKEQDVLDGDIEEEVISEDFELGQVEEYIVLEGSGGQYIRPPKRVSLAEYKRRRTTTDDHLQRRDSTSSESSQTANEKELSLPTQLRVVARADRTAASTDVVLPTATSSEATKEKRLSPLSQAVSEALKAELVSTNMSIKRDKPVTQPVAVGEKKTLKENTAIKEKVSLKSTKVSEKSVVTRGISPVVAPSVGSLTTKEHGSPSPSIASPTSSVQSKDSSSTMQSSGTSAIKFPTQAPSTFISSRVSPYPHHRFGSTAPAHQQPTFPHMLPPHTTLPSHAPSAPTWGYGHLFYPQTGMAALTPQDHWPFGHQFFPPGATQTSNPPLDFPGLRNIGGFDDIPPPPPPRSPDLHMPLLSRSRSISRSRSMSISRSPSRSRSRSRSLTSRSRSRSPLGRLRSRTSRSRSRSRGRSPRRVRSRLSRSPRGRVSRSPRRTSRSPRRTSRSPRRTSRSPRRTSRSPRRTSRSPRRTSRSPRRASLSPRRTSRSPPPDKLNQVILQQISAHFLQSINDKMKKDSAVQASPNISSMGSQIGSGFKHRSISCQTRKPPRRRSRGVQISPRMWNIGSQTVPCRFRTTSSQTHIKKRNVSCQTNFCGATAPLFQALFQNQNFSEFTNILEQAQSNFAKSIGLNVDEFLDDDSDFDESSSSESSGMNIGEEDDASQLNAPSPVISGASNISDGEWSDLEGSNSNSRKESEPPTTPTDHMTTVADARLEPECEMDASTKIQRQNTEQLYPSSLPRDERKFAYGEFCSSHPVNIFSDEQSLPVAKGSGLTTDLNVATVSWQQTDVPLTLPGLSEPSVEDVSHERLQSDTAQHFVLEPTSLTKNTVTASSHEVLPSLHSQKDNGVGSTSTVSNQPASSYGPALPPGLSPEPAPVTSTPVHGPPLPAPRTTYDVPLPPTYGPPLPPSTLVSGETLSQEETDKESFSGKKVVSVSKEDEASESEGVWQIRSLSLPPFKMSGGSNSNSGQSTPLVSNWSSPLSSPGNDSSKVEQGVKNSWKSVSPPSSSDYPDPSSKLKQRSSESPSANYQKRHTHKESREQLFKSPSERKRKRKRVNSSPVEKRRKRESLSDDRRHSSGSAEPMEAKDGSPSMEFSSLLGEVRKAASTSPPSHRKFGSEAVLVPVKKKPVLTAQELLEKVRAKRIRSPDENTIKQVGAKSDRSSSESAPESPIITNKQEVLSPPWTREQMAQVTASSQNPSVNMTQLMMNFHQHMAAKKIRDGSWMHHRPLPPPPPPPPPIGPFIWPPPPPPVMPPTSPPPPPPTVRSTTTTLSSLTPVSSSEKPSTSVASDHFLVSELVQQTNDNSGAVGPAETAHHHSHSPSKQDSEQAKESLNKEEVTKSGDVSTSLSDQTSGNGNSKEQTPSSLDQVVDTNKPDVKEETKSISLTVNLESTSVLDAPCPVPESQINVMYQSSVLDPVSPDDLSNNYSLHSNNEEQCLSSEKDEQEGTLNQDNVRPIDFSSGSDTISESKTSPNVSTAEKDSSIVDSSEWTPKDIEVKGSKNVVSEHTSESDLINKPTPSADQFSQACKSTESTVSHPVIALPAQQPSLSPPESTPPRSFDTVVKSTTKQSSTETCATTERVAADMPPVDTSPLSEKKDQQRQSQDLIKGSKETASVSAVESSSQDSGASTNPVPVVASQSKRPAPPSVNVLISKIRSILTNCSVYSEEAKMRAIVEASTEFQKAINQGGSPASSSDLEAKNPKLPPKSPTDLAVKVVDKGTVCDEGEADGIHSVKELQSGNSADQPCSDDLKEDKKNLSDCIQGMHDASKKDGVNQYPSLIDEHSSPEGGQESRDLSPEVLRGKVSEEPPELTDVSGEDFVVSPSPSCSPIKPPSTMCSLRERATRYEFASVAKRDTCLLISHGNGSSDTSAFSCDSLEENDTIPGESVTVEASPLQDSHATDSKQIESSNSALAAESANIGTSDSVDLSKLSSENESQEHPTTDEPTQITADQDASGEMVVVADEVEEATCSLSRNEPVGEQETETAVMTESAEKDHIDPASVQEASEIKEAICKGENEVPAVESNMESTAEECDMESIPVIEFKSENMSDTAATVSEETFTTEQSQMDSGPIPEKEISPDSKSETVILSDTTVAAEVGVDQCQTKSVLDSENDTKVATAICGSEQGGVSCPADKDSKRLASDEASTPAKTTPTPDDAAAVALATPSTKDDVPLPVKSKSSESKSEETMSIVSAMLQAPSKEHIQTAANISTKAPPTRRYPTRYSTRHAAKLATPTTDTSSSSSVSKPSTPALDLTASPGTNPKVMLTTPPTSQSSSTPSSRVSATLSSLIAPSGKNSPAPAVTFEGLFTLIQALFNRNPQHQLYLSIPTTAQAGQQQSSSASTSTAKQAPSSEIKALLSSLNTVKTTACSKASIPKKASTSHCSSPVVVKEDSPIKAKPLQDGQTSMKAGSGDNSDKDRVDMKDVLSNVGDESEDLSISPPTTDSGEDSKTGDQCSAEAVLPLVKEASRPTSDHTLNPNVKSDESAEVRISEVESAKDPSSTECGLKLVDLSNEIELTEKDTDLEASQDPSPRDTENRSGVYETESEKNSSSAEPGQEFIVSCEITSADQGTDLNKKGQNPTSSDTSDALCEITQLRIDSPVHQQSGESMAPQEVKDKENEEEEPVEFPVIVIGQEKKQIQSELKDVNVECHQDCPIAEISSELTSNIESETSDMPMSSPSEAAINQEECDKGSSHVKSSTATRTRDNPVGSMTENEPVDTFTTLDDNNIVDVKQAARSSPESATQVSGEPDKSAGDFDEGSTSVKSSLSMKPLNVIKSFSSSELQQRKCKSPLFISLPAHYSSEYNKRTIKGPSERYRTVAQGRDESYEPLVVSLPLPLYWRRWEELNSLKVPQTQPNEESVLDRPGLVLSHKGDKNEEDQSSPLVVSFPLKSLQLSTAVRMFNNTLASSQLHNLANIPIVEIYCDEENGGETSETSSCNMFLPCGDGIKQSQSPTDHSHPLVSNFSPALSISPECKTTKRMLIGGHYDEGDEETMQQKNDLKSMLTKKAESPNSKEQLTMPETFVDFLTPTDNVTCEQEPEQEAHIVAVTPVEWNKEQLLCTKGVAVVNPMESSPLAPATGEILTEACSSSLISVGSTPRQKLMKKNRLLKTFLEPKTNTEENVATDRPPLKLRLPKPLYLMMSSSVKGAVSSEKRVSPTKSDTSSLSPSPSPKGQSTSKVGPVRRRKRAGTQGEQKRSKDKLKCSKQNILSLATSIFGSGTISEAKKTYHTPSTDCKSEYLTSPTFEPLPIVLLSDETPYPGHNQPDSVAVQSVPESPTDVSGVKERHRFLPALAAFVKRSKRKKVPYVVSESPSPAETPQEQSSPSLPSLSLLLDTNFRAISHTKSKVKSCGKSTSKSRQSKRSTPAEKPLSAKSTKELVNSEKTNTKRVPKTTKGKKKVAKPPRSSLPSAFKETADNVSMSATLSRSKSDDNLIPRSKRRRLNQDCHRLLSQPSSPKQTQMETTSIKQESSKGDSSFAKTKTCPNENKSTALGKGMEEAMVDESASTSSCRSGPGRRSSTSNSTAKPSTSSKNMLTTKKAKSVSPPTKVKKSKCTSSEVLTTQPSSRQYLTAKKASSVPPLAQPKIASLMKKSLSAPPTPVKETLIRDEAVEKSRSVSLVALSTKMTELYKQCMSFQKCAPTQAPSQLGEGLKTHLKETVQPKTVETKSLETSVSSSSAGSAVAMKKSELSEDITRMVKKVSRQLESDNGDPPAPKRIKLDGSKHSERARTSPMLDSSLRAEGSKSPVKLPDRDRRERRSSSRRGSRASSVTSCSSDRDGERMIYGGDRKRRRSTLEREGERISIDREKERQSRSLERERGRIIHSAEREERPNYILEMERERPAPTRHPYRSSRELTPPRYRGSSPSYHHFSPRPPRAHLEAWHCRSSILGDPPLFPHPPPSFDHRYVPHSPPPPSRPPPPPPLHHPLPLPYWPPLPGSPPSPYGPPASFLYGRNPYDQRNSINLGNISPNTRYGRYPGPPQERPYDWYSNWRYNH